MPVDQLDVSRETIDKLRAFEDLLRKWTRKINLVSQHTLDDLWERHILDSAQVYEIAPHFKRWVDLGSGGGLPGVIIAVIAAEKAPDAKVHLIESDQRKCVFLRSALRELDVPGEVIAKRIDDVDPMAADIVTARALADLDQLLSFASRHMQSSGTALFPKGARWSEEDQSARSQWSYSCEPITSKTNPEAAILKIKDIVRV